MDTQNPVIINTFPTPKEQLVSGVIGIGLMVGTVIVISGSFYVVGKVAEKMQARKTQKAQQNAE